MKKILLTIKKMIIKKILIISTALLFAVMSCSPDGSEFDDTALRTLINQLQGDITELSDSPGFNDSALRELINQLQGDITELRNRPGFDDSALRELINQLQGDITELRNSPGFDDSALRELISQLNASLTGRITALQQNTNASDEQIRQLITDLQQSTSVSDEQVRQLITDLQQNTSASDEQIRQLIDALDGRLTGLGSAILPQARDITAGGLHTCALLLADNTVKCWGDGGNGQLGYGNLNSIGDDETPNTVGVVNLGQTAKAITAGDRHTCALLADNTVKCWGYGSRGRLGYGNSNNIGDNETPNDRWGSESGTNCKSNHCWRQTHLCSFGR